MHDLVPHRPKLVALVVLVLLLVLRCGGSTRRERSPVAGVSTSERAPTRHRQGRRSSTSVTPSIGAAFGVQDTSRENGATAYDASTPSTWAQLAPALTLSLPFGEVRGGVRIPLDEPRSASVQLGLGFVF